MPKDLVGAPVINRDTPAWRTLETLLIESPPSADQNRLIVFGSAALQLTVTSKLLSADIDLSLDLLTVGGLGVMWKTRLPFFRGWLLRFTRSRSSSL